MIKYNEVVPVEDEDKRTFIIGVTEQNHGVNA